jgi:HK97 gp10 family phage protein
MNVNVDEVKGLAELDEFLKTLPDKVQRDMLFSSLMTAAKPVMDQAKANVRQQFGASLSYTGTLERGVVRGRRRKTGLAAAVDVKLRRVRGSAKPPGRKYAKGAHTTDAPRPGRVNTRRPYGDDPFYGRFLEMGTSKMAAKPWLKPAGLARQSDAGRALNKALQKQMAKWCKANGVTYRTGVA